MNYINSVTRACQTSVTVYLLVSCRRLMFPDNASPDAVDFPTEHAKSVENQPISADFNRG